MPQYCQDQHSGPDVKDRGDDPARRNPGYPAYPVARRAAIGQTRSDPDQKPGHDQQTKVLCQVGFRWLSHEPARNQRHAYQPNGKCQILSAPLQSIRSPRMPLVPMMRPFPSWYSAAPRPIGTTPDRPHILSGFMSVSSFPDCAGQSLLMGNFRNTSPCSSDGGIRPARMLT